MESDRNLVPEAAPSQRADDATLEAAMFGDVELAPRDFLTVIDPALTFYVLDDEPAVARAVTRRLQRFGYTVVGTAHEPTQALREILELRPRLAILDLNLNAVLDGVDVATHLRAAGFDAPIVFFTGETQPNLSALHDTEGVFAYVPKAELSDTFRTTLDLVMTQDATRRRLREVDHRHRLLFEQAAVGVAELDVVAGQLVTVNQRCAALVKRTVPELLACTAGQLFEPCAIDHARRELARARHEEVTVEVPCRAGDGSTVHLRFDATPLREGGRPASRVVMIVQDVTERTLAERAREQAQYVLDESQRVAGVGSYAVDLHTGELSWSAEMYRLFHVDPATFRPTLTSVLERIHPDDRGALDGSTRSAITDHAAGDPARGNSTVRYRVLGPDGSARIFEGRGEKLLDTHGRGVIIGTVRDVTQDSLAEAALRDGKARYRSVFENAIGGIVRTAMDGTIIEANPAFVTIVGGTSAEQVIATDLRTWFSDPEVAARLDLRRWHSGHALETTWRRLDGGVASVVLDGVALEQGDGQYFLGFVRDLTAERARSAREREAIEASRAKTAFLAGMSHELRTPLNAVLGLSEALLEGTFGALAAPQLRSLETVHASGQHLLSLINDVLDIARVEAGQLPIEPERVGLREPIDESLALIYGQASQRGVRVVAELPPVLPSVDIDKRRIKQVLLNLLGNAVKFSPAGATITLQARMRPGNDRVELAVIDRGPGIPPEDRERIFEPFVTLDRSVAREFGGAGLGLTMVKRIVELHGGSVQVDTTPGGGSTFVVELPVPPMQGRVAVPMSRGSVPELSPVNRPVVLLAEDNPANVLTVQSYLESRGYAVRVVHDGASAVVSAAAPDVAAVLMDVRLPVIDGLEAMRRIRAAEPGEPKPIIALTAYAMPDDERRCLDAGATSYLSKPVRLAQLADRLSVLLTGGTA